MRSLKQNDLADIERILLQLHRAGSFSPAEVDCAMELLNIVIAQPEQTDYLVLVATDQDRVVGYILYGPTPLTHGTYDIYWIATSPSVHGRGFGRQLLQTAEQKMRALGARLICLETAANDYYIKTRYFYERAGYRQEAVIADFYSPGDARITYVKRFA